MLDLHNHFLFGVDDGPKDLTESVALLQGAIEQDVSLFMATPHIHPGTFDNDITSIKQAFHILKNALDPKLLSQIELGYAAEVRICAELPQFIAQGALPYLGHWFDKRVLLLEMPHSHVPVGCEQLIDWLLAQNIQPMIAHPERNRDIWKHPQKLGPLIKKGCLFQITAGSLLGDFGELSQQRAKELIEADFATIIASDSHSMHRRPPKMKDAFHRITDIFDERKAKQLCIDNPQLIVQGNVYAMVN